ncbi:cytochrome P450 [Fusarium albosuccineum]|uniref:Cytochrome P450 n=1 Tax=Fusarium albosuccineum TaxID=1237068 RepID=A0A8H4KZG5_9HYPO|nr:cytochrome P450 [Fusarium albosuccineum]
MLIKELIEAPRSFFRSTDAFEGIRLAYLVAPLIAILIFYFYNSSKPNAPFLNPQGLFVFTHGRSKKQFLFGLRSMLKNWFDANPNKAACVFSDIGPMTVLPPSMANEIRSDPRLSFVEFSAKFFHTAIPGFEAFNEGTRDSITLTVINKDLTKKLAQVTQPLAEETTLAMKDIFTDNRDWHVESLRDTVLHLIARISSRVFLGEELCRDESWLKITREHAMNGFVAADLLRAWPEVLRPVVHWFLTHCRTARSQIKEAATIIGPVIAKRRAAKAAALKEGRDPPVYNDAIEWFEQASKGASYDPALSQLFLSTVAIHTTTDLLCQTMIDIARHPELFEPLREEIMAVLREEEYDWKLPEGEGFDIHDFGITPIMNQTLKMEFRKRE